MEMEYDEGEVFECDGKKGGTLFSDGSGFFYRIKEKRKTRWRLICHQQSCKGTGTLMNPDENNRSITHNGVHSCAPSPLFTSVIDLRRKILDRCKSETSTSLSQIFNEETTKR